MGTTATVRKAEGGYWTVTVAHQAGFSTSETRIFTDDYNEALYVATNPREALTATAGKVAFGFQPTH